MAKRRPIIDLERKKPEAPSAPLPILSESQANVRVNRLLAATDSLLSKAKAFGVPVGWIRWFEELERARSEVK